MLDTIAAIATAPGRGGIGIVRISGVTASAIAQRLLDKLPPARKAQFMTFRDDNGQNIDQGLALFFPAPHSFTGEDVVELQGHGGPIVMDMLLQQVLQAGARLARPGEFSERAFLNHKMDLTQAEATADLIAASSTQAARAALRSLTGEFSQHIQTALQQLINLRTYLEAAIDFSEEEIDFLSQAQGLIRLQQLQQQLVTIEQTTRQGVLLREGITIVLAGKPNAGKSSLLNRLSGRDSAIVTEIAGTTRDLLREHIHLGGLPLHIIDTAGLRESTDTIEQEGIRRAKQAIAQADQVLFMLDSREPALIPPEWQHLTNLTLIHNKIDLVNDLPAIVIDKISVIKLSAKTGAGMDLLIQHLQDLCGFNTTSNGHLSARRRHLIALQHASEHMAQAAVQWQVAELAAEELRLAQGYLSEITGVFSSDDLLGEIFGQFCVGK